MDAKTFSNEYITCDKFYQLISGNSKYRSNVKIKKQTKRNDIFQTTQWHLVAVCCNLGEPELRIKFSFVLKLHYKILYLSSSEFFYL